MTAIQYLLLFSLVSNNLTNYQEDILNYSPTVMFRGTPCIKTADHNSEISKQGAFDASHVLEGNVKFTSYETQYLISSCNMYPMYLVSDELQNIFHI